MEKHSKMKVKHVNMPVFSKTISSIATLIGQKGFIKKWLDAKNTNNIRDLILLSNRTRFF